jgi:hypothetical protein
MPRLSDIQSFAARHPWLGTQAGAKSRCVDASLWFLQDIGVPAGKRHAFLGNNGNPDEFLWHAFVKIGNLCIDWTARQYDPEAPFPKVWLSTET